ncbi:MAG: TolC family protein [Bacteroidetes bacterium]|nr:MAG: TolC family protein [Bacteroidota bacterium]
MRIKKLLTLSPFLIFFACQLRAQDKWDLKRCVEFALHNNISIKLADVDARVSKLVYEQSKYQRFGQAQFATQFGLNFGRSIDPTTNLFTSNQSVFQGISLQAGANLFNWFSQRRLIEANQFGYEAQRVNIDKVKSDVTLNVAAAYLTALLSREQVNLSQTKLDLTRHQLDNTRKLVAAGSVPELNAAELEAQYATDTSSLISAQQTFDINVLSLKAFLNLDAAAEFELDTPPIESIPVEPISELQPDLVFSMASKTFPQQKMNELRVVSAQKNVLAVKGIQFPTLSVFGSLGNNFANDLKASEYSFADRQTQAYVNTPGGPLFVYTPTVTSTKLVSQPFGKVFNDYWTQLDNNFRQQIGLQLSIPIFNGGQYRTNYQKAKLNVQTVTLQKESDLLTLKQNIYQAYFNAVASLQKFESNRKAVATAERSFDLATKRFNVGLLSTIDYLVNQNNLFTAKINQISSHYDFVFKMKVLEYYKGLGVRL